MVKIHIFVHMIWTDMCILTMICSICGMVSPSCRIIIQ